MSVDRVLRDTLASVLAELDRLDPHSLVAARAHGVLDAVSSGQKPRSPGPSKPHPRRLERHKALAEMYASGLTMDEVAEKMGCNKATVRAALTSTGTPARNKGNRQRPARVSIENEKRIERIRQYRAEGKTLEEIGALEKVTRERIRQLCVKAGIPTPRPELKPSEIAAVADYLAGASIDAAAETAGLSPSRMVRVLYQAGHKPRMSNRGVKHSAEVAEKARQTAELYKSGVKVGEIAERLGISCTPLIYRYLAIAGVRPARTQSSRARLRSSLAVAAA